MTSGEKIAKPALWCVCAALAANLLFAIVALVMATADPAPLVRGVRNAFDSRDLLPVDWLDDDPKRGANTFNECLVLQMAINDAGGSVEKAFRPRIYVVDSAYHGGCAALQQIAFGRADYGRLYEDTYARYWHGYVPLGSVLTRAAGISGMRIILRRSVYAALVLLLLIAVRAGGRLAFVGAATAVAGATVWALPYYGQCISYAPGDACVILGLAAMIAARRKVFDRSCLASACAVYGAVLVYFDYLTGQIPKGAGLLFATAYALARDNGVSVRQAWTFALTALAAMVAGAVLTVAVKQGIVFAMAGAGGVAPFTNNLAYYTGIAAGPEGGIALYAHAFRIVTQHAFVLTHNRSQACLALMVGSAAAWLIALALCTWRREPGDFFAFAFAALAVPAWIMLMPRHTIQEAAFMVRILIVPIALGLALCGRELVEQLRSQLRPASSTG